MKISIVWLCLALSLPVYGKASNVRPYLQALVEQHGLSRLAATPMWRRYFPANIDAPPSLQDFSEFIVAQLSDDIQQLAQAERELDQSINGTEAKPDELAQSLSEVNVGRAELEQLADEKRTEWVEEHYPPPTEEKVLAVLEENDELRARMVAFHMALTMIKRRGLDIPVAEILFHSYGVAMLLRAIDRTDLDGKELNETLNSFTASNAMRFDYVGDLEPAAGVENFYEGRESYLLRSNHLKHGALPPQVMNALWARGYVDTKYTDAMTPLVTEDLLDQVVLPEDELLSTYGVNLLVDLLSETGIIGNFIPTIYQAESLDLLEDLAIELGVEIDSDAYQQLIALLDDKKSPASLLQITQLTRMGFSVAEIKALTYEAREAIIVSSYEDRQSFIDQYGDDMLALNKIVTDTGELVFFLLQQGYAQSIEDIGLHHAPRLIDMQQDIIDNEQWQSLFGGGKLALLPGRQPPGE